jgi:hypothetical protein
MQQETKTQTEDSFEPQTKESNTLMFSKKNIVLAALTAAAAALLVVAQTAWSGGDRESIKLEGAWVARLPGTPTQWNYVMSSTESSGRRASLWGVFTVPIPGFLYGLPTQYEPDELSPFSGELVLTGRNEAAGTVIWWGLKNTVPSETYPFKKQVVHLGVDSFTVSFAASGKAQATHHMKFYDPSADADGDGLPDPGKEPVFSAPPITSSDTSTTLATLGFHL